MSKQAFIVVGLGYGDEGKGTITDYITRKYKAHTVIRFNGGSQAAHHVVSPEGLTHCFAQFGSGTLISGVNSYLSRYMVVDPLAIEVENTVLQEKGITDALTRLTIDENCLVVTPFHKIINRMQEISRGQNRHGSCGKGVGQTILDGKYLKHKALIVKDLVDEKIVFEKLKFLWQIKLDLAQQLVDEHKNNQELISYLEKLQNPTYVEQLVDSYKTFSSKITIGNEKLLARILSKDGAIVFEGAQGVLLDFERGFWPYITKSCTTFKNAEKLLQEFSYQGNIQKVGVLRAYSTRHGAGPFVTEDKALSERIPDIHNGTNSWQSIFRLGWFDLLGVKYACQIVKNLDALAITNLDRFCELKEWKICVGYKYVGLKTEVIKSFFNLRDRQSQKAIVRIKVPVETSPTYQKQLAELLKDCQPIYQEFIAQETKSEQKIDSTKQYLAFISKKLKLPIKIVSFGATAQDKQDILSNGL